MKFVLYFSINYSSKWRIDVHVCCFVPQVRPFPLVNLPACNEQGRGGPIASNGVRHGIGRGLPNDEGADFIDVDVVD